MLSKLLLEFAAAYIGTIAFALIFHVPRKYYGYCGLTGGCGWLCYRLFLPSTSAAIATFISTVLVITLSRFFAVRKRCPVTLFLISGIFPLVPGTGIYRTAYYVVINELDKAGDSGFQTVKIAVAIVLGILFVFEFPQKWFQRRRPSNSS